MNRLIRYLIGLTLGMTLIHCAPTRFVEPLKKGQKAIGFNFGGPMISFAGATIPVPFTSVFGGYGYTDDWTLFGGFHVTSAVYKNIQFDLGATRRLRRQDRYIPAITTSAALNSISALPSGTTRLFPQFDLHASWKYTKKWYTYLGASAWIDFYKNTRQSDKTYRPAVYNFYLGQLYRYSDKWHYSLEYKLLDPWDRNDRSVVDYVHWSSKGAQGLYLSVQYNF